MKIGDIAARTGIAASAIRIDAAGGLLPPPGRSPTATVSTAKMCCGDG